MNLYGVDLETAPLPGHPQEYALQPWRKDRQARITRAAVAAPDGAAESWAWENGGHLEFLHALHRFKAEGAAVVAWNAVFDLAWLLPQWSIFLAGMTWLDGALLWKWLEPGLNSYKLAAAVRRWCADEPWAAQYLELKAAEKEAGFQTENTALYNKLDAWVQLPITQRVIDELDHKRLRAAAIEARCLIPVATSWTRGIPTDPSEAEALRPVLVSEMEAIAAELGVEAKVLSSPKQLGKLIYEAWGWPVERRSDKTDDPSTDAAALTYATDHDPRAGRILDWRERKTRLAKYVDGVIASAKYNGEAVTHPGPRIYSTYTGRMTYESKVQRKKAHPVGVALHQWCREKRFRALLKAPPDHVLVEFDASGQEMRFMAEVSQDPSMLRVFRDGLDAHAYTGAGIAHLPYPEFMRRKAAGDEEITGPRGYRHLGKLTNLSLQYRTWVNTLRRKARVDYEVDATLDEARLWYDTYHGLFPGVRDYWDRAIALARDRGYAETFAGRRMVTERWKFASEEHKWGVESTAINFPIQGAGADQKYLALATLDEDFPALRFAWDFHDGIYFFVREKDFSVGLLRQAKRALDTLNYAKAWDWTPSIPFPWDCKYGTTWGNMKELKDE